MVLEQFRQFGGGREGGGRGKESRGGREGGGRGKKSRGGREGGEEILCN